MRLSALLGAKTCAKVLSWEPKRVLKYTLGNLKSMSKCPLGWQNTLNCPHGWLKHDKLPFWELKCMLKCPSFCPCPSKSLRRPLFEVSCWHSLAINIKRQTPDEVLKAATIGVLRSTRCYDDIHNRRLTRWKAYQSRLSLLVIKSVFAEKNTVLNQKQIQIY